MLFHLFGFTIYMKTKSMDEQLIPVLFFWQKGNGVHCLVHCWIKAMNSECLTCNLNHKMQICTCITKTVTVISSKVCQIKITADVTYGLFRVCRYASYAVHRRAVFFTRYSLCIVLVKTVCRWASIDAY